MTEEQHEAVRRFLNRPDHVGPLVLIEDNTQCNLMPSIEERADGMLIVIADWGQRTELMDFDYEQLTFYTKTSLGAGDYE